MSTWCSWLQIFSSIFLCDFDKNVGTQVLQLASEILFESNIFYPSLCSRVYGAPQMPPGVQPVAGTAGAPAGIAWAEPPASRGRNASLANAAPYYPAMASPAPMREMWESAGAEVACPRAMMPPSPGRTPWARGLGTGALNPWRHVARLICLQTPCRYHTCIVPPAYTAPGRPTSLATARVLHLQPPRSFL